jgi:glucokinase
MAINKKDPLCLKVVEKFTENYGTEAGNISLKTLPYGGVYLIGGVTAGIQNYLLENDKFMEAFRNKGRLEGFMN